MSFHKLDVVVLNTDLPAQGLKRGDLGAVVDVYSPDAIEVEFVTAWVENPGPNHLAKERYPGRRR